MQIDAKGLVRSAALSLGFSLLLVVLVAAASNELGRMGFPIGVGTVIVTVVGAVALVYAGVIGGRAARRAGLERHEIALTATLGCGLGYLVLVMLNFLVLVIGQGEQLTFEWGLLYHVLPYLACGAFGGWLAGRPTRRKSR